MAQLVVEVCDVCMDPVRTTQAWTIDGPEGRHSLLLCTEHSEPLRALLPKAPAKPVARKSTARKQTAKKTASRSRARRATQMPVATLEEIEAMKLKGKA